MAALMALMGMTAASVLTAFTGFTAFTTLTALTARPAAAASAEQQATAKLQAQARQGDPAAMALLGRSLARGEGMQRDPEAGLDWLRRAAERGNVQAMYWFASMLFTGEGGPANPTLAVSWLRRASESGHVASMFTLAKAYASGQGTAPDLPLAYAWITIVTRAEPLLKSEVPAVVAFRQEAGQLRERIGQSLEPAQREAAEREALAWQAGQALQLTQVPSRRPQAGPGLPPAPAAAPSSNTGPGLPPAPQPVPGADNPLNQKPGSVDPARPAPGERRSQIPGHDIPGRILSRPYAPRQAPGLA